MYIDVCHPLNNTYIFNTSNFSWFLENNVSVINCSWGGGHKVSDVNYCRMENLVNQLSLDNLITFVFVYPERLIPLLVATADNGKIKGFTKNQFGLDAKAGGGMLDLKKFLDFPGQCDSFTANSAGTISFSNKYYVPKQSEIGKTLKICLFWMSTDTFGGGNTSDAEEYDISNPSLLSMQLRAKVGSNYVGTINSDGLTSNVLVLYVPISSLTPITVEINSLSSGRTTKGAVAYCVQ